MILFRPVMDYIREKCSSLYVPNRNLSLDEGMMKWNGRLSIRVYNPKKPCKYGVKFYFLCEAESGYVLDFHLYNGHQVENEVTETSMNTIVQVEVQDITIRTS